MAEQQRKEQQQYQRTRDPFEYGRQVAQRRYSEIMSGLAAQRENVARSYSDMYQAAKQSAVAQRAAGAPSLSGGMKAQYSDLVSAREMQQLGAIGAQREQAQRDIYTQAQSAMANAELEGQQATEMRLQEQQTQLGIVQQKNQILADEELTNEQKAEQLNLLGYGAEAEQLLADPEETGGGNKIFTGILGLGGTTVVGGMAAKALGLAKGVGVMKSLGAVLGVGLKFALPVAALALAVWSVDELVEGITGGEGFLPFV